MPGTASRSLREGMAAALAREFEAAYELLKQATTESPSDVRAWFWRALASPSPTEAMSCLRRVLLFEPAHTQAQYALGRLLAAHASSVAATGQHTQAMSLAREAAELAPESDAVWIRLAAVCQQPTERLEALQRAMDLNPHAPQVRMLLRDALLHCGVAAAGTKPEKAQEFFREAAKIDPEDPRVWQALARVATRASDAVDALRQLVRVAPDRPAPRAALRKALGIDAELLAAAGSTGAAAARWREALGLDEHDATALVGLAATTDNRDEARRALETARRLDPTDTRIAPLWARWQLASEPAPPLTIAERAPIGPSSTDAPPTSPRAAAPVEPPAPSVAEPPRPVAPRQPVAPLPALAGAPAARTVLVVDDSPTVRKILSMTLERAGYSVVAAQDGEAALVSLDGFVPDLIMLDISMPKLDGYEVCKRIKSNARTAHVPVVMLSGKDAFFDKVKGRMAGATEYLTKPFETAAVLAVIGRQFQPGASAAHG
jgi:twitching motility two-component system response regulator PilG